MTFEAFKNHVEAMTASDGLSVTYKTTETGSYIAEVSDGSIIIASGNGLKVAVKVGEDSYSLVEVRGI